MGLWPVYGCRTMSEPEIAQKTPFVCEEEARTVAWCACGRSANQPYCDGAHSREKTGLSPIIVTLDEAKTVAWCSCKQSGNAPYCDGTHASL